jgi:phospholipid transport system substrate-binding protein
VVRRVPFLVFLACAFLLVAVPKVSASSVLAKDVGRGAMLASARSAPGDPLKELRRADQALEAILRRRLPAWSPEAEARKWRVDAILGEVLDHQQIARASLGADWSGLTSEQQRRFLETLSALTNQAFVAAMARSDLHLRFDSETVLGPVASVMVTAWVSKPTSGPEQQIEYRLARRGGRWLVRDVLVDGVSLVDSYHDQFARLMRRGGFAALIDRMQRKLEDSSRRER